MSAAWCKKPRARVAVLEPFKKSGAPATSGFSRRQDVGKDKPIPVHGLTGADFYPLAEHGAVKNKGVELAVFTAGVDAFRQRGYEGFIIKTPGKLLWHTAWVDAGDDSAHALLQHEPRQLSGGVLPEREKRFDATARELPAAVRPHIFEKEIAESDMRDAAAEEFFEKSGHDALVFGIAARPGQTDDLQGQSCGTRLPVQQVEPDSMHGCAFEFEIYAAKQPGDFPLAVLLQLVEHPGAVFACTPGNHYFLRAHDRANS